MSTQPVLVTYASQGGFLLTDQWKQISTSLESQLPLRNLHWKSASRTSIRTVQELDVKLVPLETIRDEHTPQIPLTILERPLLNVYIVICEDHETYKTTVKKQIKDWHATVTQRKNQEWLIVHVERPESKVAQTGFFQVKSTVLDKIKADFNVDKRDRCVQLVWSSGYENPATWAELISKIKDGVLSSFDSAVTQREDEIKRSENQRQMPGWNFCTFFILKESLANSFEGVKLFEDSLLQYNELEASFYQVLREKNLSWFGSLIMPGPKDDSLPLLSATKKSYRDSILANTISIFDFRVYLLARQCTLLGKMGKVVEVGKKSSAFLNAFGKRLLEAKETIPKDFVESWTYSSALSVVEQCDVWALESQPEAVITAAFNATKAELIELARHQLDTLGVSTGHLSHRPPFSKSTLSSTGNTVNGAEEPPWEISNVELLAALKDKDAFYDLYVKITNRAIDLYAKSGRRKFALKLHGSLAALEVHRERLQAAFQTYSSLPAHYSPHKWTSLESFMLINAMSVHTDLDRSKDRDWIHIVLAFLKTYVEGSGSELLLQTDDEYSYISGLLSALQNSANELDSDLPHPDHPAISISIEDRNAAISETEDGSFIDVIVHNHLPCNVSANQISISLAGRDVERLTYEATIETLGPGANLIKVFCPLSSPGRYRLDSSEVRIGHLLLQWSHCKAPTASKYDQTRKGLPTIVRVPKDLHAFDVRVGQPRHIQLGMPPRILVTVFTGRSSISRVAMKFSGSSGVEFHWQRTTLEDGESESLEVTEEAVSLVNMDKETTVSFHLPHSDASAFHVLKVLVDIEYASTSNPSVTHSFRLTRMVPTSLPVAVNVQDFFRGTRLFSKFTISTTSHQYVRIRHAELSSADDSPEGLAIIGCSSQKRGLVTVTPAQPANFLFQLTSKKGPVREPLHLTITYRMLREEVEDLLTRAVDEAVAQASLSRLHRDKLVNALIEALESDATWVERYIAAGELKVPSVDALEEKLSEASQATKEVLHRRSPERLLDGQWRQILIPVDVPQMNIIAAAELNILSNPFSSESAVPERPPQIYAGQPVSAVISISTSFHWSTSVNARTRSYRMRFDVEEMIRDWLVSGRKRGDFLAKDGGTFTIPVTLIALHHGELSLPKIAVTPLPLAGEMTMGSLALPSTETYQVHGAEQILVLPRGGRSTFIVDLTPET